MEKQGSEAKKQVIEQVRYYIQNLRRAWSQDERGLENQHVIEMLKRCDELEINIEEVAARYVASMAYNFKENCRNFSADKVYNDGKNSYSVGLFNDNEKAKATVGEFVKNYTKGDEKKSDDFVQTIYEAFGFEGKLPTKDQLRELKRIMEDKNLSDMERQKAERKLQIAERKLGMQWGRSCNVFEMTYGDLKKEQVVNQEISQEL